ncbi:Wzz/FepE/Etk N-terminal domain-containing protein [Nocardiopsis sp. LOL_012]|uniref:Wzz/FepE/Etk N-terminal domain-containing protein n=1 Tax=Nocardiopsis sp. LOL_012 TaxID=3345409 RepID=UPI003A87AE6A
MDTEAAVPPGPELREYTALLRRRWRTVAAGVLGGTLLATAGVLALPRTYESTAAVQVRPTELPELTGEQAGRLTGDINLDTEAQVLLSDEVSAAVAERLGGAGGAPPSTSELRERVSLTVPANSNVLEVTYAAGSPEAARRGADAYAEAYLAQREAHVQELLSDRLEALRGEQELRYEELSGLKGDSTRAGALRAEITDLGGDISPLGTLRETLQPGRVITPAALPEGAAAPLPALWLPAGAALGLLAGLLLAAARDRLDPVLRGAEDTGRIGGVPVLMDLSATAGGSPLLPDDGGRDGQHVNGSAHAVRARLRARDASGTRRRGGVLLVAATAPGRAGTAAAADLAAALVRTGSDTLLVCADPDPGAAALLGLSEGPGLAEVLTGGTDPAELETRSAAAAHLRVLRYGRPGSAADVQGTAMPGLVSLLRERAEYTVIAVPSAAERADVHALAASVDLLLPVVEAGRTRRADLRSLLNTAARFGAPVAGVAVLPRQPRSQTRPTQVKGSDGASAGGIAAGAAPAASVGSARAGN